MTQPLIVQGAYNWKPQYPEIQISISKNLAIGLVGEIKAEERALHSTVYCRGRKGTVIHLRRKKSGSSNAAVQRVTQSLCVVFMPSFLFYKRGMGGIRGDKKK